MSVITAILKMNCTGVMVITLPSCRLKMDDELSLDDDSTINVN